MAAYVSSPFSEYTKLILKISSNVGADLVLAPFLVRAHVDPTQVVLTDGHGGPNDRFTPQSVTDLLCYWIGLPEFAQFRQMLPILGEHGNLSGICTNCPANISAYLQEDAVA